MEYKIDWEQYYKESRELIKLYKSERDRYKWLYKVACLAIHDTTEISLEEIKKDFERLWNLTQIRKENIKNVNK